jgi:hypothetical protein
MKWSFTCNQQHIMIVERRERLAFQTDAHEVFPAFITRIID